MIYCAYATETFIWNTARITKQDYATYALISTVVAALMASFVASGLLFMKRASNPGVTSYVKALKLHEEHRDNVSGIQFVLSFPFYTTKTIRKKQIVAFYMIPYHKHNILVFNLSYMYDSIANYQLSQC